jgi:hypothetical protein
MLSKNKIIFSILSLGLGIFLIWLILKFTDVKFEEVITGLYNLNPWWTILAIIMLLIHTWFTAYKWQIVTHKLSPAREQTSRFYLFYTTLGSLTMQFMPQYIGMVAVQNLALRMHKVSSLSKGFLSVIYDQFFSFLIPALLFPPAILFVFKKISLSVALFLAIAITIGTHFIFKKWYKVLIVWLINAYSYLKNLKSGNKKIKFASDKNDYQILDRNFTLKLYWISVIRYLFWIVRGIFIVWAAGLNIDLWAVIFITPIVQLAMLLSFTPANLGLMELSWVGLLALFQVPHAVSIEFALLQRFLYVMATALALVGFLLIWSIERLFKFKPVKNK